MENSHVVPTNIENTFSQDEIIVSKTDLKGEITYVNDVFCNMAEATEEEMVGKAHSVIRHPDMPRSVFKFLWQRIEDKKEIFAYVKNMAKTGNYYWVFAHVTPTMNKAGEIVGYHSSRRQAPKNEVGIISEFYDKVLGVEKKAANRKQGLEDGLQFLAQTLEDAGMTYDEFVWQVGK